VLERRIGLKVVAHHGMFGRSMRVPRRRPHQLLAVFVLVVHVFLAHEVLGTLVLMCAAILYSVSVVLSALSNEVEAYILVSANGLVNIAG
jgi:hypothetical protein